MQIHSEKKIFKFLCNSFLTKVHEKIRFNWVREMVKLKVNWSFVIFSNKKINLDNQDGFKYY